MSQDIVVERWSDEWLSLLRELAAELEAGMNAVAANQVIAFERCVERQQLLCHRLGSHIAGERFAANASERLDAELSRRIRVAAQNLRRLNARYASLLRHSGRALRMFSALEESSERYLPVVSGAVLSRKARQPSWSCEG
jgi:hypothetical protein